MRKTGEKVLFKGNWLTVKEEVFINDENKEVKWECIRRKNTNRSAIVVAKLVPSNRYILIKQFRQAINNYVIGLPAGLIEEGEDVAESALRELEEETGYIGIVKDISMELKANAALMDDCVRLVKVEIDEENPKNQNPQQKLEKSEEIEVFLIERDKIRDFLFEQKNFGIDIGIGVWYAFAI